VTYDIWYIQENLKLLIKTPEIHLSVTVEVPAVSGVGLARCRYLHDLGPEDVWATIPFVLFVLAASTD